MTQTPDAGWYTDPGAPAAGPGGPPLLRYWDGTRWTEHVQPAPYLPPGGTAGQRPGGLPTTPDGQRLAGWWQRVGAYLIDNLIIAVIGSAVGWPLLRRVLDGYADYIRAAVRASENGTTPPSQTSVLGSVMGPLLGVVVVTLLVGLVYNTVFLKRLAATPGKLALGLRVRLRERPGPLTWRTVLVRWATQNVATVFSVVPVVGTLASVYPLLDSLWPLWDGGRQALHDKAAGTMVVRARE